MNLSSLVHTGKHQTEHHFGQFSPRFQQVMASSLVANPYTIQQLPQNPSYAYVNAPQPPPSPPVDEATKCSLPSISSLLGIADGPNEQNQQPQSHGQSGLLALNTVNANHVAVQQSQKVSEYSANSSHQYNSSPSTSNRGTLPPTPPMQSEAGFDERRSPSMASHSSYSAVSAPSYYYTPLTVSAINNVDPESQRQHIPPSPRRISIPASMGYPQSPFNGSPYTVSPGTTINELLLSQSHATYASTSTSVRYLLSKTSSPG